ncbi:hypothetical protein [Moritella yayanosii]|uniref:Uncharacterized protein n=1 Tax=Moritella yayanosii TaxID=69539 RepID=A0A330LL89_9GAMM|nr:hypothetical protein [Moritella yayanosii]SQD76966.1 membrane protein of unknown function, might releated with Transporter transmembrane protein-putative threonine efflux protein [Moritella yayanosii]
MVICAGSVGAFGIGAGTLVHVFAAAFGLSAMAFTVVKVIGCIYLLYHNSLRWITHIKRCHLSSSIGGKLKHNQRLTTYLTKFTGALFLFFGIKLALSKQS